MALPSNNDFKESSGFQAKQSEKLPERFNGEESYGRSISVRTNEFARI